MATIALEPFGPNPTAGLVLTDAIARHGIVSDQLDDVGNTWLHIPLDQAHGWDKPGPYLAAFVTHTDPEATVCEPVGVGKEWHVTRGDGSGREETALVVPAGDTQRVAEFIVAEFGAAAMRVIFCAQCDRHPFVADANGNFTCADGHEITTGDLDLEPGQVWGVTPLGFLACIETTEGDETIGQDR